MTTTASASGRTGQFPFDFAPQRTQDADLLRQLNFVPGLKEVLTLRQVHALEHATVWVLSQSGGAPTASPAVSSIPTDKFVPQRGCTAKSHSPLAIRCKASRTA